MGKQITISSTDSWKAILIITGAFAFGNNAAVCLHEWGHAIAVWLTGGEVTKIIIDPFTWSYTYYHYGEPGYELWITWAGFLFSMACGALLLALIWQVRQPLVVPFFMTGVMGFVQNGAYFSFDALFDIGGDAASLIYLGVPRGALVLVGLASMGFGLVLCVRLLPLVGIGPDTSFCLRIAIFGLGIVPYMLIAVGYNMYFNPSDVGNRIAYLIESILLVLALAWISLKLPSGAEDDQIWQPTWGQTLFSFFLGAGFVFIALAFWA